MRGDEPDGAVFVEINLTIDECLQVVGKRDTIGGEEMDGKGPLDIDLPLCQGSSWRRVQ